MRIVRRNSRRPSYTPVRSMFDDFFGSPTFEEMLSTPFFSENTNLSADVWEEGENFHIKMALPGIKKDDIDIEINGDVVTIKGQSSEEEKEDSKKNYFYKSLSRRYEQSFNLKSAVDAENAKASFNDGVLELTLPKLENGGSKRISID